MVEAVQGCCQQESNEILGTRKCTPNTTTIPAMLCDEPHQESLLEDARAEVHTSLGRYHLDIRMGIVVKLWW